MKALLATLLTLFSLVGTTTAQAAHVLGVDAARPVKKWVAALEGLKATSISIDRDTIHVAIVKDCVLGIFHPSQPPAMGATQAVGNTILSWSKACDDIDGREAALSAAGPITLPWIDLAGASPAPASGGQRAAIKGRAAAKKALARNDLKRAQRALLPLLSRASIRPIDRLGLIPLAAASGLRAEAWAAANDPAMNAVGPALLAGLRTNLLAGAGLGAEVARVTIDAKDACHASTLASAGLATRAYDAVLRLASRIRELDPGCFSAYQDEAEAATMLRQLDRQRSVTLAAMERFPGDPRLAPMEEAYLVDSGRAKVVQERLEKRLAAGDRSSDVVKELIGFYIAPESRAQNLERFRAAADGDEKDTMAAFFAGVLLHYTQDYAASTAYLERVERALADEARLYIYRAMNAFNLGDMKMAKKLLGKAEKMDLEDPDVVYCIGEVYRDEDRKRALAALQAYWHQTAYTSDPTSVKQRRVQGMIHAIERCIRDETPAPCPGPWEHTFDSVAMVAAKRAADEKLVKLKEQGLIGGGTTGAPPGMELPPGVEPPPGFKPPPGWDPSQGPPPGFDMPAGFEPPPGWDPSMGKPPGMQKKAGKAKTTP
jgi:tetratricopeptide (TPR) repeat protein